MCIPTLLQTLTPVSYGNADRHGSQYASSSSGLGARSLKGTMGTSFVKRLSKWEQLKSSPIIVLPDIAAEASAGPKTVHRDYNGNWLDALHGQLLLCHCN